MVESDGEESKGEKGERAVEAATRVSPGWLRSLYGMSDADVGKGAASNNTQAVASFLKQYYAHSDTAAFQKKYPPPG